MNKERLLKVLLSPHISEKSTNISEGERAQCVFKVASYATKHEIKLAIEQLFDSVVVASVRVCSVKAKVKKFKNRLGKRKAWKKAYVTLAKGSEIHIGQEI